MKFDGLEKIESFNKIIAANKIHKKTPHYL